MKIFNLFFLIIIITFSCNTIFSQKMDEAEGRGGFLANMGYPEEVHPFSPEAPSIKNYHIQDPIGKDILLIVNYNFPHYQNNSFIRGLYQAHFPNIVFYGPTKHPEVEQYNAVRGYFGYIALALAMEKYPHYQGYLFIEDDCTIHFWNFIRFDKNKIWMADYNSRRIFYFGEVARWSHWNNPSWGSLAMKKVYNNLPPEYLRMLQKNVGIDRAMGGLSDIVYFPARFRTDVIKLCKLCHQDNLFIEITIPTIACCLDMKENWESLYGRACDLSKYNAHLDFIHPIKFSSKHNRLVVQNQFLTILS